MGNEAAERTEEATPRRRQKEREKGNVSKSRDMDAALVMVAGVALFSVFAKFMGEEILNMMRETFSNLKFNNADVSNIMGFLLPYFRELGIIILPFFVLLVILTVIIIRMDVGHVFALDFGDNFLVRVTLSFDKKFDLPVDSSVSIETDGIFGGKHIELIPGAVVTIPVDRGVATLCSTCHGKAKHRTNERRDGEIAVDADTIVEEHWDIEKHLGVFV